MKKVLILIALMIGIAAMNAQSPLEMGEVQLNAGLGLSSWGVPIYFGFDYGIHRDITMGAEISWSSYKETHNNHDYDRSVFGISGNGNYHFNHILNIPTNWDFYAGVNLGYNIWNDVDGYNGSRDSGLVFGAQVGGRYYFSEKVGINLEFGGGNAFTSGKLGVTIKM